MWKLLLLATIIFHLSNSEIISKRKTIPIAKETCPCWWDLEGKQIDPNTGEPFKCACCKKGKHVIQGLHCRYSTHIQFQCGPTLTFLGMSIGQESMFLAVFDLLYSSSGPQKLYYKSCQKFVSLGAKNKMTMFHHVERCLDFLQ